MSDRIWRVNQEEKKSIQWLLKARGKTSNVLKAVHRIGKRLVCTDGFRAHSIPIPKNIQSDVFERASILTTPARISDGKNPIYALAVTDSDAIKTPEDFQTKIFPDYTTQVHAFAINPQYLSETLRDMSGSVVIRFYGNEKPVVVESNCGKCVALIMPMTIDAKYLEPHPIDFATLPD